MKPKQPVNKSYCLSVSLYNNMIFAINITNGHGLIPSTVCITRTSCTYITNKTENFSFKSGHAMLVAKPIKKTVQAPSILLQQSFRLKQLYTTYLKNLYR